MKQTLRLMMTVIGLLAVLLFCVSAMASIVQAPISVNNAFSEPLNLVLLGSGLIGLGSFLKSRKIANR